MSDWEPDLYDRFRRYRAEPVEHILARLDLMENDRVADLGCGPGNNTLELATRVPHGSTHGIDLSPAMIEAAEKKRALCRNDVRKRVSFEVGDISRLYERNRWSVIFSNAALQWLQDHRAVLTRWFNALEPGGRMVVQMPANEIETAKVTLGKMASEASWAARLGGVKEPFHHVGTPDEYQRLLSEIGFVRCDCYYLTFHHPMKSPAEVVEWYRATGLRPFLDALATEYRAEFLDDLRVRLEHAYGTSGPITFDFRRLFIWARKPSS